MKAGKLDRREISIPDDGWIAQEGLTLVEICLGSLRPEQMATELLLLTEDLAAELTLRHPRSEFKVHVRKVETEHRAIATPYPSELSLALSPSELGYWLSFFAKYYRDGAAEVDHLDLEAKDSTGNSRWIDVRLNVAKYVPPVSDDAARRRHGSRHGATRR